MRKERGWTQERLADESGVSPAFIGMIEGGKKNPSLDLVERLADIFGATYDALFKASENVKRVSSTREMLVFEDSIIRNVVDAIHREFMKK